MAGAFSPLGHSISSHSSARRSAKALGDASATLRPTEATVQGPFYWEGAPVLPLGSDIGKGMPGEPAYYSGRVTDTHGRPIAACCVDVWSGDGEGAPRPRQLTLFEE